jgi:hypothetical protein
MSGRLCRRFSHDHFINVAPNPGFSGFDRTHHGMLAMVKVFGRVFVLGRIAAAHTPADHAQTQVNPGIAHFHALFADTRIGGPDFDLIQMFAFRGHYQSPNLSEKL